MKPNQSHVAGLELARLVAEENWPLDQLLHIIDDCIVKAKSTPAEVAQGEAALSKACAIAGCAPYSQHGGVVARLLDAGYTAPPSPDAELVALLKECVNAREGLAYESELLARIDAKLAELSK